MGERGGGGGWGCSQKMEHPMKHEALGLSMRQLAKSVCHHLKVSHKPMFQALPPKRAIALKSSTFVS